MVGWERRERIRENLKAICLDSKFNELSLIKHVKETENIAFKNVSTFVTLLDINVCYTSVPYFKMSEHFAQIYTYVLQRTPDEMLVQQLEAEVLATTV